MSSWHHWHFIELDSLHVIIFGRTGDCTAWVNHHTTARYSSSICSNATDKRLSGKRKKNEKVLIFQGWSVFISFISFQRGVCFRSLCLNQEKLCRYGSTGELRLFKQLSSVWLNIILLRCWLTGQTLKRRKWKSCTLATLMHLFKFIKINIPANSLIQDRSNRCYKSRQSGWSRSKAYHQKHIHINEKTTSTNQTDTGQKSK